MAKTTRTDSQRAVRRLLAAGRGARMCYGEPVRVDGRTVIPVARVRAAGGLGQRGGGGRLDAVPVGYIEVTADGTRFEPFATPRTGARALATGGAAVTALLAAVALRRPRPALPRPPRRRLLPR
ncbi:MAG TPA: hypothetical protein VF257_07040 [Solirubrobacteraceae bacterium]